MRKRRQFIILSYLSYFLSTLVLIDGTLVKLEMLDLRTLMKFNEKQWIAIQLMFLLLLLRFHHRMSNKFHKEITGQCTIVIKTRSSIIHDNCRIQWILNKLSSFSNRLKIHKSTQARDIINGHSKLPPGYAPKYLLK